MNQTAERHCPELYLLLKDFGRSPMITYLRMKAQMSEPESSLLNMLVQRHHQVDPTAYVDYKFSAGAHQFKSAKNPDQGETKDQDERNDQERKNQEKVENEKINGDQEKEDQEKYDRKLLELESLYSFLKDFGGSPMITHLRMKAQISEPESSLLNMLVRGPHRLDPTAYVDYMFSAGAHQFKSAKNSDQGETKNRDEKKYQEERKDQEEDEKKNGGQEKENQEKDERDLHRACSITYAACTFSAGAHQYKSAKSSDQEEKEDQEKKKDQEDTEDQEEKKDQEDTEEREGREDQEVKDPEKGEDEMKNGNQEKEDQEKDDRELHQERVLKEIEKEIEKKNATSWVAERLLQMYKGDT